jgi:hypothetical protein
MIDAVKIVASLIAAFVMIFAMAIAIGAAILVVPALAWLIVGVLTQNPMAGMVAAYLAAPAWLVALYLAAKRRRRLF